MKSDDAFWLSERNFCAVEVVWTDHQRISRKEAEAIKKAGICDDWFNCLKESHK